MMRPFLITVILLLTAGEMPAAPCAKTVQQQDAWVHLNVNRLIKTARAAYEEESATSDYTRVLSGMVQTLKRCGLGNDREFVARNPTLIEYVRVLALENQRDHELGFEVSDRVYFEQTRPFVTIPDFLLTPEFLRSVKRFKTLDTAKALLRTLNTTRPADQQLLFFSYESRHLGTPDSDNSYRRLLIVVPGNRELNVPEKWVQFGITDPGARAAVRNVSVVAVVDGPDNTRDTYFKDYFRTYRRDGSITVRGRWELGYGDDNCVKCHKSGVLPIFPVAGSVREDEKAIVEAVNRRFLSYGAPRFGGYLDTSKFGPGLGSARLFSNSGHTACSSCHQRDGLGSLNWPMDSVLISSFVEGGRMPMGSNLKDWESTELYEQLIDDYFSIDESRPGILKAWLLGRDGR